MAALLVGTAAAQQRSFDIPAEDAVKAIPEFARQAGIQITAPADQLKGVQTPAVKGSLELHEALARLISTTGLIVVSDDGQTIVLSTERRTAERRGDEKIEEVTVTGSRIPRAQVEGPAPITVISAKDIQAHGFADTADIMTSVTQNLGAVDNNQNTDGFTPGAQAVDLRGLGPNHTLVLVNGRRIADYPQSYGGSSNFTDISGIPASMIDRIEILTGAASAVYGSDAISGVINFNMKQKADGTTIDFRAGDTEHGGGSSERLQVSTGYSDDKIDLVFGAEFLNQEPLWAYQRSFADSRLNSPGDTPPSPVFVRMDQYEDYIDPGRATCQKLSALDHHSIIYAYRPDWGYYCGSYNDVGYGTLENARQSASFYNSFKYHINGSMDFFLELQASRSDQQSYNTPLEWESSVLADDTQNPTPFYNAATNQIEYWQRRYFTIEENGGFVAGEIHNDDFNYTLNTGLKGGLPNTNWTYEALFGISENFLEASEPALVAAKAQAFYLGPSLGVDPASGLNIYNAPPSRLYTPLTVSQFRSITQDSIDRDSSGNDGLSLTVTNSELFPLPAGPVGFAAVAEFGHSYYELNPDPDSLNGTYYGLHNSTASGGRDHWGGGLELSVPVFSSLTLTGAGRYDEYSYGANSSGKFTYSAGVEYRPIDTLLLRASYGTGFRAPDLAYLFAGLSGSSSDGTDYYLCRKLEPGSGPDYYDNCTYGDVSYNGQSIGSTKLKDETSKSFTTGLVFSPAKTFDLSFDYYYINLTNEVEYQSSDQILREEADCRLGQTESGTPVDIHSTLCQTVLSQVSRNPANAVGDPFGIRAVLVVPINAAMDRTSGLDANIHWQLDAGELGTFDFDAGGTYVLTHDIRLYAGDPIDDELTDLYYYVIPKWKANQSVSWTYDDVTTTVFTKVTGGLPNYDGTKRLGATYVANASINYKVSDRAAITFTVDNVLDTRPGNGDNTWTSYPYYSSNWFSPVGREFFLELNYRFGG